MAKPKEYTAAQIQKNHGVNPDTADGRIKWKFQAKRNGVRYYVAREKPKAAPASSGRKKPATSGRKKPASSGRKKAASKKKKK